MTDTIPISGYVTGVAAIAMCKTHMTDEERGPGRNACPSCMEMARVAMLAALPLDREMLWESCFDWCSNMFAMPVEHYNPYKEERIKNETNQMASP